MTVELLQNLSVAAWILCGICFLCAAALFFLFDVPKLIGDISGANAKRAIARIRRQNAQTGDKTYKPSEVNIARGKLTDRITPSGRIAKDRPSAVGGAPTARLGPALRADGCEVPRRPNQPLDTEPAQASQTTVLAAEEAGADWRVETEITYYESDEIIE